MIRNLGGTPERPLLVIDMHAHLFNADDLPVRGFVQHADVGVHVDPRWASVLGWLARLAPGSARESHALDRLIVEPGSAGRLPSTGVERFRFLLLHRSKSFRLFHMGTVALRSRRSIARGIEELCADGAAKQVQLFVPLCVDLEHGSRGLARTPPVGQFAVQCRLSEATLRRAITDLDAVTLPFVGFDPRRAIDDERNSLAAVKSLVRSGQAIGVKLYPPMGFFPLGGDNSAFVDRQLRDLYSWCVSEEVPITAHCSPANDVAGSGSAAHPDNWRPVLTAYSRLRLNLAHVGGIAPGEPLLATAEAGWLDAAAKLIGDFDASPIYADVGNHDLASNPDFFTKLRSLFDAPRTALLADRLMFGTDYWFLLMHENPERFLENYATNMYTVLGSEERYRGFMGLNAREFLGFDDPWRQNRVRVKRRIDRLGVPVPEPLQRVFDGA